ALLVQRGDRRAAAAAWLLAERAGSREALFALAEDAARTGRPGAARDFYRRYLDASPDGPRAEEARRALSLLERTRTRAVGAGVAASGALLVLLFALAFRRRSGKTLAEWLKSDPAAARELRGPVGRLRHEVFKHGGLFLRDASARLGEAGSAR